MKKFEPFEIVKVLKEIFLVYSQAGPCLDLMSRKNFLEFFKDCRVSHEKIKTQDVELLLASEQRKNKFLGFECFLQVITRVSKIVYPNLNDPSESIYNFLDRHIISLYNSIESDIKLIDVLSLSSLEILDDIFPMISDLYKSEFPWEIFNSQDLSSIKKSSQSKILTLVKVFRIFPDLISYPKTLKLLKLILNNEDFVQGFPFECIKQGTVFTSRHFLCFLFYCCEHSSIREDDNGKRLVSFFQHIEAWLPTGSSVRFSLIRAPKVINYAAEPDTVEVPVLKGPQTLESLENVFRIYSVWQEKLKKHTVSLNRFVTLANNAGLLNKINIREIELLFFKITSKRNKSSKEQGKMDFTLFCQAINEISLKLYPGPKALKTFCQNFFNKLLDKSYETEVKAVLLLLKEPSLLELTLNLSETLHQFSRFYMNENQLMNFEVFFKFCKDFSVFPDLIQRKKLTPIFYTLASTYSNNAMMLTGTKSLEKMLASEDEYLEPQFINFELFVEAIAVCALENCNVNRTSEQKLDFAIHKIAQSQGANEISRKSGHTRSGLIGKSFCLPMVENQEKKKMTFIDHLKTDS
jgi:hypothetical protein